MIAIAFIIGVAALVLIGDFRGVWSHATVMRDPAAQFGFPIYGGFVSYLGVGGWLIAATATGLTAAVRPDLRRTLIPISSLSVLLMLDDLFMLHEAFLPARGVPETAVFLIYGAIAVSALWPFLGSALTMREGLLSASACAMALSLCIDFLIPYDARAPVFLEDITKFAGIMFWAAYWLQYCFDALEGPSVPR